VLGFAAPVLISGFVGLLSPADSGDYFSRISLRVAAREN